MNRCYTRCEVESMIKDRFPQEIDPWEIGTLQIFNELDVNYFVAEPLLNGNWHKWKVYDQAGKKRMATPKELADELCRLLALQNRLDIPRVELLGERNLAPDL